jgi:serine/threonine-protein kinase
MSRSLQSSSSRGANTQGGTGPEQDLIGAAIGEYRIEAYVGAGGMGLVYKAYDTTLKRHAALKFLRLDDPPSISRLLREAQAQAGIQHENVCRIYGVGEYEGKPYIAMQFIEGTPLRDAAKNMGIEERVRVLRAVALGLAEAHRMGVIHRDIKPANILVQRQADGSYKPTLLDFGLAREGGDAGLTTTGEILGTPLYMAPEQARGQVHSLDFRTDIYSLGATMYEILAGRPLFDAQSPAEQFVQVLSQDPVTLRKVDRGIPQDLETITMKCVEKEARRRYGSALEVADELERYLSSEPIQARRAGWLDRLFKIARKHKAAAAIACTSALLVLGLAGAWAASSWRSAKQAKLMGEFRQEMRYIETRLNYIRTSPIHDVRKEEAELRRRLNGMGRIPKGAGRYARGPLAWAKGQGALLFQDYDGARVHLEEAWERHGMRTPDVAYSLGLTLAELYERSLKEVGGEPDPANRARLTHEAELKYRDPARRYLEKGRGLLAEAPEYVEAKLALLAGDTSGALGKAQQAIAKTPWLYEAKMLLGDIRWAEARALISGTDPNLTLQRFREAEQAFLTAAFQAPSDGRIYGRMCGLCSDAAQFTIFQAGSDPSPWVDRTCEYAGKAALVNPGDPVPDYMIASAYFHLAEYGRNGGGSTAEAITKCVEWSNRSLAKKPGFVDALIMLGAAEQLRASQIQASGGDAAPAIEEAIRHLTEASRLDPKGTAAGIQLGNALYVRSKLLRASGQDPRPSLSQAAENYRKALLEFKDPILYSNLGFALSEGCLADMERGADPRPGLEKAIDSFRLALQNSPTLGHARFGLALALERRARYLQSAGSDPLPDLRLAIDEVSRAGASFSETESVLKMKAALYLRMADCLTERGDDPGEVLATLTGAASEWVKKHTGEEARTFQIQGAAKVKEAAWALKQGRPPEAALSSAEQLLRRSIAADPKSIQVWGDLIRAERIRSEWALSRNLPTGASIERGLALCEKALKADPNNLDALADRGALRLLRAKAATAPADRGRWARLAQEDFRGVLERNTLYHRDLDPLLSEAKSLAAR